MKTPATTKPLFPIPKNIIAQQEQGKHLYCLICHQELRHDHHPVRVTFDCSAVLLEKSGRSGWPSDSIAAVMGLFYHRTFDLHYDVTAGLDFAGEARGADFTFHFCSTKCLRSFFNRAVDEFEQRIKKAEQQQKKVDHQKQKNKPQRSQR